MCQITKVGEPLKSSKEKLKVYKLIELDKNGVYNSYNKHYKICDQNSIIGFKQIDENPIIETDENIYDISRDGNAYFKGDFVDSEREYLGKYKEITNNFLHSFKDDSFVDHLIHGKFDYCGEPIVYKLNNIGEIPVISIEKREDASEKYSKFETINVCVFECEIPENTNYYKGITPYSPDIPAYETYASKAIVYKRNVTAEVFEKYSKTTNKYL